MTAHCFVTLFDNEWYMKMNIQGKHPSHMREEAIFKISHTIDCSSEAVIVTSWNPENNFEKLAMPPVNCCNDWCILPTIAFGLMNLVPIWPGYLLPWRGGIPEKIINTQGTKLEGRKFCSPENNGEKSNWLCKLCW